MKVRDLRKKAEKYLVGGVDSPVRSFKYVGIKPLFVSHGKGARFVDVEGRSYIDYCLAWGCLILGHNNGKVREALTSMLKKGINFGFTHTGEVELAELLIKFVPCAEKVRFTNSGTEAVMTAIRLARAYRRKNKIIKFEGAYHGHNDYLLVAAGSGQATSGVPFCKGIPEEFTRETITLPYNNKELLERTVKKYRKHLAAIIIEPVMGNCGVILPERDFLQFVGSLCKKYGIVLIFDEVITGFRLSLGGAQEYFGVIPDLSCLGKIIGGGLPVGVVCGRKEIMNLLAPEGEVYQAGTFSANPLVIAAGLATMKMLASDFSYKKLAQITSYLCKSIEKMADKYGIKLRVNYISSMFSLFFTDREVIDYNSAQSQDKNLFRRWYRYMFDRGIHFSPSPFEANFLSWAHSQGDIDITLGILENSFKYLRRVR